MAMKCRGLKSTTNYDHQDYEDLLPQLEKLSKASPDNCMQEYLAILVLLLVVLT